MTKDEFDAALIELSTRAMSNGMDPADLGAAHLLRGAALLVACGGADRAIKLLERTITAAREVKDNTRDIHRIMAELRGGGPTNGSA